MNFYEITRELARMREITDRAEERYANEIELYKKTKDLAKKMSRNNAFVVGSILGYPLERIKKDLNG